MNRNQKYVLAIAAGSVAVLLGFPPFDQFSLANSRFPAFGGFYPFFMAPPYGVINTSLLLLEVFVVLVNAGFGLLLARDRPDVQPSAQRRRISYQNAVLIFASANLLLVMLFPPLESVFALTNAALPSFEGFYLIFHKRPDHTVVTTLLYLEVMFILANAGIAWLIFRPRGPAALSPEQTRALAAALRDGRK